MSTHPPLAQVFATEARKSIQGLIDRYGLDLDSSDPRQISMGSDCCWVSLRWGSGHVPDINVLVSPRKGKAGPPDYFSRERGIYGLGHYLYLLNGPLADFSPRPLTSAEDVENELQRITAILTRHGGPLFNGSFTDWQGLKKRVETVLRERKS